MLTYYYVLGRTHNSNKRHRSPAHIENENCNKIAEKEVKAETAQIQAEQRGRERASSV